MSESVFAVVPPGNPWVGFRRHLERSRGQESILDATIGTLNDLLAILASANWVAPGTAISVPVPLVPSMPSAPSTFAFPLDWPVANRWSLLNPAEAATLNTVLTLLQPAPPPLPLRAELPAGSLDGLADGLDVARSLIDWLVANKGLLKGLRVIGAALVFPPWLLQDPFLHWLLSTAEAFATMRDSAAAAAEPDIPAAQAVSQLILAGRAGAWMFEDGEAQVESLFGVTDSELLGVGRGLDARTDGSAPTAYGPAPTPVVYLDSCITQYAGSFSGFRESAANVGDVHPSQQLAAREWARWWRRVSPAVQVAECLDALGRITRALVSMDDTVASALPVLARSTGPLFTVLDQVVLPPIQNALTGVVTANRTFLPFLRDLDLPSIFGFLVRQVYTDLFIEFFARTEGIDRSCLYQFFWWMDSSLKRSRIAAALGPLVREAPPALHADLQAGGFSPGSFGHPVYTRACVSPLIASESVAGALGEVFRAAIRPGRLAIMPSPVGPVEMPLLDVLVACESLPEREPLQTPFGAVGAPGTNLQLLAWWLEDAGSSSVCHFRTRWEPDWLRPASEPDLVFPPALGNTEYEPDSEEQF